MWDKSVISNPISCHLWLLSNYTYLLIFNFGVMPTSIQGLFLVENLGIFVLVVGDLTWVSCIQGMYLTCCTIALANFSCLNWSSNLVVMCLPCMQLTRVRDPALHQKQLLSTESGVIPHRCLVWRPEQISSYLVFLPWVVSVSCTEPYFMKSLVCKYTKLHGSITVK